MDDPNSWTSDLEILKVGDTFTEEWLDRFRALMVAYNEAADALEKISNTENDDGWHARELASEWLGRHKTPC